MDIKKVNLEKVVNEVEFLTSKTLIDFVKKETMLSALKRLRNSVRFCSTAGLIEYEAADLIVDYLIDQAVEIEFYGTWQEFNAEERARRGLTF